MKNHNIKIPAASPAASEDTSDKIPVTSPAASPAVSEDIMIDSKYVYNRFIDCIEQYETEYNISISDIKQIRFNHVLEYIHIHVLECMNIDIRNTEVMNTICNIYLSICRMYNKTSSIYGYSILTGIPYNTLKRYKDSEQYTYIDIDNNYLEIDYHSIGKYRQKYKKHRIYYISNTMYSSIVKKISEDREHALTDKVEDGSIPSLALGKIEFGWIESQKEKMQIEMVQSYRLPKDILDKYSDN